MKIEDCPKCKEKGWLIFTTTKKNGRKYPKIRHYNKSRNPPRYTHTIKIEDVIHIHFDEKSNWYKEYEKIILEMDKISEKDYPSEKNNLQTYPKLEPFHHRLTQKLDIIAKNHVDLLLKIGKILEENGFLKNLIPDRICWDFHIIPWSKEFFKFMSEQGFPPPRK